MAGARNQHIPENFDQFVTLPDEKLLLVEKKHWFILVREFFLICSLSLPFSGIFFLISQQLLQNFSIFISGILLIVCVSITLIVKSIVDWHFHVYIVTNRKVIEVRYSPLFFYKTNVVLLDQVRCTEIDEKQHGLLNELLDMGDITMTFDRPTHQDEFVFQDVKNPRELANILNTMFASLEKDTTQPIWYKKTSERSQNGFFGKGGE
jgi:hypothetical protein